MEIDGRIIRQMILFTLIVLIIPMILFPILLGTEFMKSSLMEASFALVLSELVFYGFCIYFFNKDTNLSKLALNATLCLAGRYFLGAVLGLLISLMYAMNVGIALKLGAVSFWPAVLLHMVSTPFILKPVFVGAKASSQENRKSTLQTSSQSSEAKKSDSSNSFAQSNEKSKRESVQMKADYSDFQSYTPPKAKPLSKGSTEDGFNKAVNYIGESGSTLMAAVIDNEGLLLGSYQRAMFDSEDVAPLVLPMVTQNAESLQKMQLTFPEKTELMFENKKLTIATEKYYTLVVIAERTVDDVLNIRINQALEMIRIYMAERYSEKLIGNAERIYV